MLAALVGFGDVVFVNVVSFLAVKVDLTVDFMSPLANGFFSEGFADEAVGSFGLAGGLDAAEAGLELVGGFIAL